MASLGIRRVKLSDIKQNPVSVRVRTEKEQEVVDNAQRIMREGGLFNKFSIFEKHNEKGELYYVVGDGAGRLVSLNLANTLDGFKDSKTGVFYTTKGKFDEIDIEVFEEVTDKELLAIQMAGNLLVKKMINAEIVNSLYKIMMDENLTYEELAEKSGFNMTMLKKIMSTVSLNDVLKKAMDDGLNVDKVLKINNFITYISKEELPAWIEQAKILSLADLEAALTKERLSVQASRKTGKQVFIPVPKFIGKSNLDKKYDDFKALADKGQITPDIEQKWLFLKEIYNMDSASIEAQEKEFIEAKKARAESTQKKENDKIQKAIKLASASGFKIIGADGKEIVPEADKPETPETPEVPETPETPEVPEVPETPETPETPEAPETPAPKAPETHHKKAGRRN